MSVRETTYQLGGFSYSYRSSPNVFHFSFGEKTTLVKVWCYWPGSTYQQRSFGRGGSLKLTGFSGWTGTVGLGDGLLKTMHGVCFFFVEREENIGFGLLTNQVPRTQICSSCRMYGWMPNLWLESE